MAEGKVRSDGGNDTANRLAKQTEEKSNQQTMLLVEILMEKNQSVKVGFWSRGFVLGAMVMKARLFVLHTWWAQMSELLVARG